MSSSISSRISLPHPYVTSEWSFCSSEGLIHRCSRGVEEIHYTIEVTSSQDKRCIKELFQNCLFNQVLGVECELHHYAPWTAVLFKEVLPHEEWIPLKSIQSLAQDIDAGLFVMRRVCDMLHTLHEHHCVHTDLQLDNIFVCRQKKSTNHDEFVIRILGFGDAFVTSARLPFYHDTTPTMLHREHTTAEPASTNEPTLSQSPLHQTTSNLPHHSRIESPRIHTDKISSPLNTSPNHRRLTNTLPTSASHTFIAPEQVPSPYNAQILDLRTDIFHLGCILYVLFVGESPFANCHSKHAFAIALEAQTPIRPPHTLNTKIPPLLSKIIMKCLQFNPNLRYNSVFALSMDLNACLNQIVTNTVSSASSPPSENIPPSLSDSFILSSRLIHRESQQSTLVDALQRVTEQLRAEIVLLSGENAVGKSFFVRHLFSSPLSPLVSSFGALYFCSTQCLSSCQYPYHALTQCLSNLFSCITTCGAPVAMESFARALFEQVDDVYSVHALVELYPPLGVLFEHLPGEEKAQYGVGSSGEISMRAPIALDSICGAFESFLYAFHTLHSKTLVLFIDDLQFCDNNSLMVLKSIASRATFPCLIAAAHESVNEHHPLYYFPNLAQEDRNVVLTELMLEPLDESQLLTYLEDSLQLDSPDTTVRQLNQFLFKHSAGNILLFSEFLIQLHHRKLINFNTAKMRWSFDLESIQSCSLFAINVQHPIDFFVHLFSHTLKPETQMLLKYASCFENRFSLAHLASYLQMGLFNVECDLHDAIGFGWIFRNSDDTFSFSHGVIQRAAYSLIAQHERPEIHAQLGMHLLANMHSRIDLQTIIPVVHQLNVSPQLLDRRRTLELIQLNRIAAEKCLRVSASSCALHYASAANSLLPQNPWKECHAETVDVFYTLAGIYMNLQSFDKAQLLYATLEQQATSLEEKFRATSGLLRCLSKKADYAEGASLFVNLLKEYPEKTHSMPIILAAQHDPSEIVDDSDSEHTEDDEQLTKWIQVRLTKLTPLVKELENPNDVIQMLRRLHDSTRKEIKSERLGELTSFFDCLVEGYPHLVFTHQESLYFSSVLLLGEYVLTYGLLGASCSAALCAFAVTYALPTRDFTSAFIMAEAGLKIARMPQYFDLNHLTVCLYFYGSISHAHWDVPHCLQVYDEGFNKGQQCDNAWSGYNCYFKFVTLCLTGQNLSDVVNFEVEAQEFFSSINSQFVSDSLRAVAEIVHSLTDTSGTITFRPNYSIENFEDIKFGRYCSALCKAIFAYFSEQYEEAYKHMEMFMLFEDDASGGFFEYIHPLFCVLIVAHTFHEHPEREEDNIKLLNSCFAVYSALVQQTRVFHKPAFHLTKAELIRCRTPNDFLNIVKHYQKAISCAQETEFFMIEAISLTRLANFYMECEQPERVIVLLVEEALDAWQRMGASAIVNRLGEKYRVYLVPGAGIKDSTAKYGPRAFISDKRDFNGLLSTSEERLKHVMAQSVPSITEDQKADRGCYISVDANRDLILVSESRQASNIAESRDEPLTMSAACVPVVEQAIQSGQVVIINNAFEHFPHDEYIQKNRIKRIMCTPVNQSDSQQSPGGLYYFEMTSENAAPPFTEESSQKVNLMAQSAVVQSLYADQDLISRFVPVEFLKLLGPNAIQNGRVQPAERHLTLLYSNVRNFTSLTQSLNVEECFLFLREFTSLLGPQIKKHGGFLERFVGDSLLAVFPGSIDSAVEAATSMIRILRSLNQKLKKRGIDVELQIGVGIHSGMTRLGTVEFGESLFPSIVSPTVGVCHRLENLSKALHTPILITGRILAELQPSSEPNRVIRRIGTFVFVDSEEKYEVYEVYNKRWRSRHQIDDDHFEKATQLFSERKFDEAIELLRSMDRSDRLVRFYGRACKVYKNEEQHLWEDWCGEICLDAKGNIVLCSAQSNIATEGGMSSPRRSGTFDSARHSLSSDLSRNSMRRRLESISDSPSMKDFQLMKMKVERLEKRVSQHGPGSSWQNVSASPKESLIGKVLGRGRRKRRIHVEK